MHSGPWFNIKMSSYPYRKSHCGDNTVVRSSYLHNGISYIGKMTLLYWIRPLLLTWGCHLLKIFHFWKKTGLKLCSSLTIIKSQSQHSITLFCHFNHVNITGLLCKIQPVKANVNLIHLIFPFCVERLKIWINKYINKQQKNWSSRLGN